LSNPTRGALKNDSFSNGFVGDGYVKSRRRRRRRHVNIPKSKGFESSFIT
jgi:hypothetical protein